MTTSGSNTYTINLNEIDKEKKDFKEMYYFYNEWGLLFLLQGFLAEILPYLYIGLLETAVLMVFSLQIVFQVLTIF